MRPSSPWARTPRPSSRPSWACRSTWPSPSPRSSPRRSAWCSASPRCACEGLYLAIATLAAHFITTYVIIHWESMTNGVLGFNVAAGHRLRAAPGFGCADLLPDLRPGHPGHPVRQEPLPHQGGPGVHRHPRPGRGGERDGREPVPLQAPRLRDQLVLRRRGRRAHGPPLPHPVPRRVHPAGGHRLPGHDHHRRAWAASSGRSSERCS